MEQILIAHAIPARVIDLGLASYMGAGSPAALQVRPQDRWIASLLISPVDDPDESCHESK
jgi:hypothetical protein